MKGIRGRFALFVAIAAIAPLLAYGFVSVQSLRLATDESVASGARAVARQVADRFSEYFENNRRVLQSLGVQLTSIQLEGWQVERTLNNLLLEFPEFRHISVFDGSGQPLMWTGPAATRFSPPATGEEMVV